MTPTAKARVVTGALALCGVIAVAVGGSALLEPVAFFASNGIHLGPGASLLSEVRAAGGANLACGLLIVAGAFIAGLRRTSALLTTTLYLAYGSARLLGIALDGVPSESLVIALGIELGLGVFGAVALAMCAEDRRDVLLECEPCPTTRHHA